MKLEGEARVLSGAGRCTPDPLASRNNQVHRSMKRGSSLSARAFASSSRAAAWLLPGAIGIPMAIRSVLCHTSQFGMIDMY